MEEDTFETHRRLLEGIAYRMCGVLADAQDIVQETHIKWCNADQSSIREPRAWLVTTCSRLAIDFLRSAHKRRMTYVGTWLPEPFMDQRDPTTPASIAEIDESVSFALMVALERLSPAERAVFILHDVFGYNFEEVGRVLARTAAACRKLASRARNAVERERPRYRATPEMHRKLYEAFFGAAQLGDLDGLTALLVNSVELHTDGGGRVKAPRPVLRGRETVARFFVNTWRTHFPCHEDLDIVSRWFNGGPGALIFKDQQLIVALSFAIERERIHRIFALRNPDKLSIFACNRDLAHVQGRRATKNT